MRLLRSEGISGNDSAGSVYCSCPRSESPNPDDRVGDELEKAEPEVAPEDDAEEPAAGPR
jgi:hypothetical protein